ncbi:putative selenium-dependent hydroxylase accessory protein YqeC [Lachnospiraceae bacterium ZAX-1]
MKKSEACGEDRKRCIAFVGAGGKSTAIYSCAKHFIEGNAEKIERQTITHGSYADQVTIQDILNKADKIPGKRMDKMTNKIADKRIDKLLIVTTTKMYLPKAEWKEYLALDTSAEEAIYILNEKKLCIAGTRIPEDALYHIPAKLGPVKEEDYSALASVADVVLVEADGSNRYPMKVPAAFEPVYPPNMTDAVIVVGMSALNQPFGNVCHRIHLAEELLAIRKEDVVEAMHIIKIITESYLKPLRRLFPSCIVHCMLNQVETKERVIEVEKIKKEVEKSEIQHCFYGYFSEGERQ